MAKEKLEFHSFSKKELRDIILENKNKKIIFNFLNLYSVYLFRKNLDFKNAIINSKNNLLNAADGITISSLLRINRLIGTEFTKIILNDEKMSKNKKHFFLGGSSSTKQGIKNLIEKFPNLKKNNTYYYNPPYIKENKFSEKEISKITKLINKIKPDFLWIGLGNPKQEIIACELYNKINVKRIFVVGAALDFLVGTKKEAPKIIRKLGGEWLYRFITDFKYSKKKVYRSFIGLIYLPKTVKKFENEKNFIKNPGKKRN
ncbi:WecB/TagA/CpsF family glycosyltransferase [Candidatus Pacearchaeota archaeon]|nr:WecB/TagA/CpsF family glycosyltransferase [Candidatus Pacearchaeota archaeon]